MNATEGQEDLHQLDEAKKFQSKLFDFHTKIGTPLKRIPTLGGRELDVYHLYKKVEAMGGYEVVSQGRLWGEVARSFNLPSSVTSASYAIRQHYVRLLEKFESYERDPNHILYHQSSVTPPTFRNILAPSTHTPVPRLSLTPQQAHAPSPLYSGRTVLSTPSAPLPPVIPSGPLKGRCDKLARSLTSGFPNEVDFAFNVLTVMAFKEPYNLHIAELPHVLDLMLAHVGVFPQDDSYGDLGLEALYSQWYSKSSSDYLEFWAVSVPEWVFGLVYNTSFNTSPHIHNGLFASRRDEHDWCVETYRATQLATILNNISINPESCVFLSTHHGTLTFLLLASNSYQPSLSSCGLDVLVSLAPYLSLPSSLSLTSDPQAPPPLEVILHCLLECVLSSDRMIILKGLNVLSQLCWAPPNEVLAGDVPMEVWQRLFQFLLLPDIQLILLSLDTLYQTTSYGSYQTAAAIFQVARCVEILVSLLSLDIKRFGEKALSQLQVVRVIHASSSATTSAPQKSQQPHPLPSNNGSLASGKPKVGMPLLNSSTVGDGGGIRQTVKIGNCEIPVMPFFNGSKSSTPNKSSALKGPTVLTIQQIQNLLAKHLSSSNTSTPLGTAQGCGLNVGGSGGSNISINRGVGGAVTNDNSSKNIIKGVSTNLLRSYLAKNNNMSATTTTTATIPFTASSLPQLNPTTNKTTITPSSTSPGTVTPSSISPGSTVITRSTTTSPGSMTTPSKRPLSANSSDEATPTDTTTAPVGTKPSKLSNQTASMGTQTISGLSPVISSSSSSHNVAGDFATEWLESSYIESRGSYLSQLEMYSLYLIASTKAGVMASLSHTQFNNVLKKLFPDALSTRVTVGNQAVYMMVGLAKKRTSGGQSLKDTVTVLASSASEPEGRGVVTQQMIKESRGPLYTSATPTTGQASLTSLPQTGLTGSRMDYSTESPLSVSNKAMGVVSSHRNEQVNGLDYCSDVDKEGVVSKAKRIKLFSEEVENTMASQMQTNSYRSEHDGGGGDGGGSDNGDGGGVMLNIEAKKLMSRNPHLWDQKCDRTPSPSFKTTPTPSRNGSPVSMDIVPSSKDRTSRASSWDGTSSNRDGTSSNRDGASSNMDGASSNRDMSLTRWSISPTPSEQSSTSSMSITGHDSSIGHTNSTGQVTLTGHTSSTGHTSLTEQTTSTGHTSSSEQTPLFTDDTRTCCWNSCNSFHSNSSSLLHHVIHAHFPPSSAGYPSSCQWTGCSSTVSRHRHSLTAHVMTCHADDQPCPSIPNVQKTLARLKTVPQLENEVENVLTKAIRLTAALVLRNISQVLPEARKCLRRYESVLSEVALSGSEASTAALECLEYLHLPP